ncbi:hypothetical protein GF325_09155 [Candidatus Bathyarchaeota archaeon]|nr:hypothetical protein [Candidatus Bathyarchaeota archaeon]
MYRSLQFGLLLQVAMNAECPIMAKQVRDWYHVVEAGIEGVDCGSLSIHPGITAFRTGRVYSDPDAP